MNVGAKLGTDQRCIRCIQSDVILYFMPGHFRHGARQIYLVDYGYYRKIVINCQIDVGQGLGFNTLSGINDQHCPFAGSQ